VGAFLNLILEDVLAARTRIKRKIHKTPLLQSQQLSELANCQLFIKAEHLQKVGAFKARGALNFILSVPSETRLYTTFSSGNHGQATAWAAAQVGAKAVIFMPEDASPAKVAAVKGYGGEVRFAGFSSTDRMQACLAFVESSKATVVPPYDHEAIIAGQGTGMLEVLEDVPLFDVALVPCGGGGLLSGSAFVLRTLRPKSEIFACEPENAFDLSRGLDRGEKQTIPFPDTIADGMRNLTVGDRNWALIQQHVKAGLTCSEEQIREAMRLYATFMKQFIEPSGAVSLACLLAHKERFAGKKVVIYASGGNIALPDFAALVGSHAG
jgi:threonine dehydratase